MFLPTRVLQPDNKTLRRIPGGALVILGLAGAVLLGSSALRKKSTGSPACWATTATLQVSSTAYNVYSASASTTVTAPAGGFRSDDIGHEFDASGKYVLH